MPETGQQPIRTILEELRYVAGLHGSFLFAFNALVPLYPLGRLIYDRPRDGVPSAPAPAGLPLPFLGTQQLSRTQVEALIVVAGTGVAALFLPLYVRLLVDAMVQLQPKGG